jgi:hypothetical protein
LTWNCGIVPRDRVPAIWPHVSAYLDPAIARAGGRISNETVEASILSGTHLLWLISDGEKISAAMVTRIADYPLKRMLVVECLGGREMSQWLPVAFNAIKGYAKDMSLDGIEMYGREGWTRALAPYGWRQTMVLCEVDIEQEPTDV